MIAVCAVGGDESGDIGGGVQMGEEVKESGDDEVVLTLSETETINLLSISGTVVVDPGQQEAVRDRNQIYQEVCEGVEMPRQIERGEELRLLTSHNVFPFSCSRIITVTTVTPSEACRPLTMPERPNMSKLTQCRPQ